MLAFDPNLTWPISHFVTACIMIIIVGKFINNNLNCENHINLVLINLSVSFLNLVFNCKCDNFCSYFTSQSLKYFFLYFG